MMKSENRKDNLPYQRYSVPSIYARNCAPFRADIGISAARSIIQSPRHIDINIPLIEWMTRYISLQILLDSRNSIARSARMVAEASTATEVP